MKKTTLKGAKMKLKIKEWVSSILLFALGFLGFLALLASMLFFSTLGKPVADININTKDAVMIASSTLLMTSILYSYLYFEDSSLLKNSKKIVEIFVIVYLQLIFSYILGRFVGVMARPIAFIALIMLKLVGRKEAIFITVYYALIQFLLDKFTNILPLTDVQSYTSFISVFCAGTIGVFFAQNISKRIQNVFLVFAILVPIELTIVMMEVVSTFFTTQNTWTELLHGGLGAVLSVALFVAVLPIFETLFAEMTVYRLRELTMDNAKLIKQLKEEAPGTYHHSVIVANIAEACAREIGEDSELARAVAYYHDMGKLKYPQMFVENQLDGVNIHDELPPELSVEIIKAHTLEGRKLIHKAHLPEFFADVAVQHHGTLPIKYFYAKALNMTDGDIKIENFSYGGPTPTSKIAAIIMIADGAEAATRTLQDRTPQNVERVVRSIVEERIDLDQFEHCAITLAELTTITYVIVQQLSGIYHARISYPKIHIKRDAS